MLSTFFRNSRPINFLLIGLLTLLAFVSFNFIKQSFEVNNLIGIPFIILLTFLINFILVKNQSKGRHTYVSFVFILLCISLPPTLISNPVLIAGFFVVLGLRRTIMLQTGKFLHRKIFDAFFFFSVATFFVPSSFIFMLVPLWAIFYFTPENYKSWLIPFPAILSVFILATVFHLLLYNHFFNPIHHYKISLVSLDNIDSNLLYPLSLILLIVIFSLMKVLSIESKTTQRQKRTSYLLIVSIIAAILSIGFSGNSGIDLESLFLLFLIPSALIIGKFLELTSSKRLSEILLILLILNAVISPVILI